MDLVIALPENHARDMYVRKLSKGKVHLAAMAENDQPEKYGNRWCWDVALGENHQERFVALQRFAVDADTGEVFVEDVWK